MTNNKKDDRTPMERLIRLGWDALDTARKTDPPSLDKIAQNARDALETARKGIFDETQLKMFRFAVPIDNAVTADIDLDLSVGYASVSQLSDRTNTLMDADLKYLGSLSFGVSGDVQRHAYLRQSTPLTMGWVNPIHWTTRPRWDVGLTPLIPLDLRVQGGVGDANLNLTGLQVQSLRVDGNIGPINLTLPADSATYAANLRGAAGPIAVNIPAGTASTINMRGGFGGIAVNIAPEAAVQINVEGGTGHLIMKPGFMRTEAAAPGLPNTGVWQTPDFDLARRRTIIHLSDGMVGSLTVRVLRE